MNKTKKALISVLALAFCASFAYGCAETSSNDSASDSVSVSTSDSVSESTSDVTSDVTSDSTSDSDEETKPTETPVSAGALAMRFVGSEGVLDLTQDGKATLTGVESFKITKRIGKGENTTLICEADGKEYLLFLSDGVLFMNETDEIGDLGEAKIFTPDASMLAGAWMPDDEYSALYFMISDTVNEDGAYEWESYNKYNDESYDMQTMYAYTALTFDDAGNAVIRMELSGDYTVEVQKDGAYLTDYYGTYEFLPYTNLYDFVYVPEGYDDYGWATGYLEQDSVYLDSAGAKISYSAETGKVTYGETEVEATAYTGALGSGLAFANGEDEFVLQQAYGKVNLYKNGEAVESARYTPDLYVANWSGPTGADKAVISAGEKISWNGTEYTLAPFAKNGKVAYSFATDTASYTIESIYDEYGALVTAAFRLTDSAGKSSYFVSDEAKTVFADNTYTNNIYDIVVDEDFDVIYRFSDSDSHIFSQKGKFTYLEEMGVIALEFGNDDKQYLVMVEAGVFMTLNEDMDLLFVYITETYEAEIATAIEAMLDETQDDFFTTGGKEGERNTLSFDFANDSIVYGEETLPFYWDYLGVGSPAMVFVSGMESDTDDDYYLHYLQYSDKSVYIAQIHSADIESEDEDALEYEYFVPNSVFTKYLGTEYVFVGEYFNEKLTLAEDGTFTIDTTNLDPYEDSPVTAVEYSYYLMASYGESDLQVCFLDDSGWAVYARYADDVVDIFDIRYITAEKASIVGDYYASTSDGVLKVSIGQNDTVTVNGVVYFVNTVTAETDSVTVTAEDMTFTVNPTAGTLTFDETVYNRRKANLFPFVGEYEFDGKKIVVTLSVASMNATPELTVTVDGTEVDATVTLDESFNPVLSFTVQGSSIPLPPLPPPPPPPPPAPPLSVDSFDLLASDGGTTYTITVAEQGVVLSNGTTSVSLEKPTYDFKSFVFEGTREFEVLVYDEEWDMEYYDTVSLSAIVKAEGSFVMFVADGLLCSNFELYYDENGDAVLTFLFGVDKKFVLKIADVNVDLEELAL